MPPRWSRVDGNWRGKAGDVDGGGEKEGVNLEEQGASREMRIR